MTRCMIGLNDARESLVTCAGGSLGAVIARNGYKRKKRRVVNRIDTSYMRRLQIRLYLESSVSQPTKVSFLLEVNHPLQQIGSES